MPYRLHAANLIIKALFFIVILKGGMFHRNIGQHGEWIIFNFAHVKIL